jgi:hypothetical protein
MLRLDFLKTLDRMHEIILLKATGSHNEFAKTLGMSRSSLYDLIGQLKSEFEAPIIYNRYRPSYEYLYTPKFTLGFKPGCLQDERLNHTVSVSDFDNSGLDADRPENDELGDILFRVEKTNGRKCALKSRKHLVEID